MMRKLRGVSLLVTELKMKLQLVFLLLIQVSLGELLRVMAREGSTVTLNCPITVKEKGLVEWQNPAGYTLFLDQTKGEGVKDGRYRIETFSASEFSISISSVTFKDGGIYTCLQYGSKTPHKRTVEVMVLGFPKMSRTTNEGIDIIKCRAEGSPHLPQITWKFDNGPEFKAFPNSIDEKTKFVSEALLHVLPVKNRVTVTCLVRHPPEGSEPLMNFVKIGPKAKRPPPASTARPVTVQSHASTEVQETTAGWFRDNRTGVYFTTSNVNTSTSNGSTPTPKQFYSSSEPITSGLPLDTVTPTSSHLTTEGETFMSETTMDFTWNKTTETNLTENSGSNRQRSSDRNSYLLVLLVTTLIFGLLVVVIFFTIKLRRAHIAWKRENEDSDPSEESSKSKSGQEDKNSQGQRRRGLFNTAFTQYVVEEPAVIASVQNTAAVTPQESATNQTTSQSQTPQQSLAKSNIKETSL